jgi:hypothetical protein
MEENYNEKENSLNQEEEETSDEETSNEGEISSEEKSQGSSIEEITAQRDRLYARLKKQEEKIKEAKPNIVKAEPLNKEDEWKHKVEFLLDNRDVTDDEFEHLAAVALRRSGSITMDSLRNAQKQENDYISYKRKKEEDKKKVPGSTSTGYESKVKSAKDIAKMSEDEFKAYEAEMMEEGSSGI